MLTGQVLTAGKGYNPNAGGGGNVLIFFLEIKNFMIVVFYSIFLLIGSGGNGFGGFGPGQTGSYH